MGVRIFFMALALAAAGLTAVFGLWAHATYSEQTAAVSATTLNVAAPMSTWAYWLLIAVQLALTMGAGLGTLFFGLASLPEGDPLKDSHWCEILFREHRKARLREWATSLRYFRFVRGSGGGMDDYGDCLLVSLRIASNEDVELIFTALGLSAIALNPEPVPYDGWRVVEWRDAAAHDANISAYQTPGHLDLSISDATNSCNVTQAAVDSAKKLELLLDSLADKVIDPPKDDRHCVCPKYYPSFWNPERVKSRKENAR